FHVEIKRPLLIAYIDIHRACPGDHRDRSLLSFIHLSICWVHPDVVIPRVRGIAVIVRDVTLPSPLPFAPFRAIAHQLGYPSSDLHARAHPRRKRTVLVVRYHSISDSTSSEPVKRLG